MLPGLGFSEIVVLAVIALLVVGPKDLPLMLRKLGQWSAKLRAMAQEFRTGFDELARQAELDELRKEVDNLRKSRPFEDINRELSETASMAASPPSPPPATPIEEPPRNPPESPPAPPPETPPDTPPQTPPAPPAEIPQPDAPVEAPPPEPSRIAPEQVKAS